jgi:hypothetical protein
MGSDSCAIARRGLFCYEIRRRFGRVNIWPRGFSGPKQTSRGGDDRSSLFVRQLEDMSSLLIRTSLKLLNGWEQIMSGAPHEVQSCTHRYTRARAL